MTISKTRAQALEALEGHEFDCDIEEILDLIFGAEATTNDSEPPDTDSPGPPTKP